MAEEVTDQLVDISLSEEKIVVKIGNEKFKFNKRKLCELSEYFTAMFSGRFEIAEQTTFDIDVINAPTMSVIKEFVQTDVLRICNLSLDRISDLGMAANFLQMQSLISQVENVLRERLTYLDWMKIMTIAQNMGLRNLEQYSAGYGLTEFKHMTKATSIPTADKLYWYLSHPYLQADDEISVFRFGMKWPEFKQIRGDPCMLLLICLDMENLFKPDLLCMRRLLSDYYYGSDEVKLSASIVDCLLAIHFGKGKISVPSTIQLREALCEKYTERVYNEVLLLVQQSKRRERKLAVVVPFQKGTPLLDPDKPNRAQKKPKPAPSDKPDDPLYMYAFSEGSGFEKWLKIGEKDLVGWSFTHWGLMRLVLVGGSTGSESYVKHVRVYDTFTKTWDIHDDVELPQIAYAGLAVQDHSLFIVGGANVRSENVSNVIIYNLVKRTYRRAANFRNPIQSPSVVCHSNGIVYATGLSDIYKYSSLGTNAIGLWIKVTDQRMGLSCIASHGQYIYGAYDTAIQFWEAMFRFDPDKAYNFEEVDLYIYEYPPVLLCSLGHRLITIAAKTGRLGYDDNLRRDDVIVESFCMDEESHEVVWRAKDTGLLLNHTAGICTMVLDIPPFHNEMPDRHKFYVQRALLRIITAVV